MLEVDYSRQLKTLLAAVPCRVVLPPLLQGAFTDRGVPPSPHEERRFMRDGCPAKTLMELRQTLPAIPRPREPHCVLTKNISRTGIAFLHSEELFPGEQPRLWLPSGIMLCTVVRCVRHGTRCYEIGATFGAATAKAECETPAVVSG